MPAFGMGGFPGMPGLVAGGKGQGGVGPMGVPGPFGLAGTVGGLIARQLMKRKSKKPLSPEQEAQLDATTQGGAPVPIATRGTFGSNRGY